MSRAGDAVAEDRGAFRFRVVAILVAVGVIGFCGMLVLAAYAPGLRSGRNGGAHALSNAAVGYAGLVRLADATGRNPRIIRDDRAFGGEDLLVITPEDGAADVSKALARGGKPTLVVLPKWDVAPDPDHTGWARSAGLTSLASPEGVLAPADRLVIVRRRSGGAPLVTSPDLPAAIRFPAAPRPLQVILGIQPRSKQDGPAADHRLDPLITDGRGGIVLAQLDGRPLYVLADPDLLDNHGVRDPRTAAAALATLDWLSANGATGIDFDVTLNGLGRGRSPLQLLFQPPFLAMTLAVAAALLLAGWQAFARFGAPAPRGRAIAFGKAALVDNTAALVRRAGREGGMAARYAAAIRHRARATLRGQAAREGAAALDRLPGRPRFSDLSARADEARAPAAALAAAQALSDWREGR